MNTYNIHSSANLISNMYKNSKTNIYVDNSTFTFKSDFNFLYKLIYFPFFKYICK